MSEVEIFHFILLELYINTVNSLYYDHVGNGTKDHVVAETFNLLNEDLCAILLESVPTRPRALSYKRRDGTPKRSHL